MKTLNKPTYISLFSSAGIGCYGFKLEGFECIATNELITRRLEIQKFNKKCKYESGYICGDITEESTKNALYDQISLWKKKEGLSRVDVVVATPPCQGMSVANHKKSETEIVRNSLVIESIKIIKQINPRFFIFENVPAFMKTICTDIDGEHKSIAAAIENNLGQAYSYTSRVINFKNFGACSSRQRTVVIGVSKDFADEVSPIELYPDLLKEHTLREVIGDLKSLKEFGEIDENDIYHSFRTYPEHMRVWIADIKEGQSAFDNVDDSKKPHRIVDGKIVINQRKNADKYTRQYWDKVGPCIHTRNDQMASQNTVHPCDDRVFSIRELMLMMTVPYSFKWVETDLEVLNSLSTEQKRAFLKKEEIKIRQSLGEAVPTAIFQSIAKKISEALKHPPLNTATINKVVSSNKLSEVDNLKNFIVDNPMDLSAATLGKIAEMANTSRTDKVNQEILSLGAITTIVAPVTVGFEDFSGDTLIKIDEIKNQIIEEVDKIWISKREALVNELNDRQKQLHEEKERYDAVVEELQPKIQGNKAIAEFSSKILAEKDKLATFNALDKKLKTKKSEEQAMIAEIYSIPFQIKELRNEYANLINNEAAFKGHEIEFKVEVPFKKEEFLKTLETDFVIRIVKFKETIKMDSFSEEDYTTEKLREIIDKLLSGVLEIKSGHTIPKLVSHVFSVHKFEIYYIRLLYICVLLYCHINPKDFPKVRVQNL